MDAAQCAEEPRQPGEAGAVDGGGKNFLACRSHLPAGADRGGAKGARWTPGDGQGDPASVRRDDLSSNCHPAVWLTCPIMVAAPPRRPSIGVAPRFPVYP